MLTTRRVEKLDVKLILVTLSSYILLFFSMMKDITLYTNIINPIFWAVFLVYEIYYMKKKYFRFPQNRSHFINIMLISFIHFIIYLSFGFTFGFAKNPYSHNLVNIVKNVITQILPIIGIELLRIIIVIRNRDNKISLIILTVFLILLEINYYVIFELYLDTEELFKYTCKTIIPVIASNILYTYLIVKSFYLSPLIYKVFNALTILMLPVLPNINWFLEGSSNVLFIMIIYMLYKYKLLKKNEHTKKYAADKYSYVTTIVISIILVCFMLGLFPYEPISVLSNSMYPTFSRGDVLIFKKLNEEQIKNISEDSIIIYNIEKQNIAHRVILATKQNDNILYQTKGDSNNAPDMKLVHVNQVKGIYVFHIKYIGFPSVWLYEFFNNQKAKVETK